MTAEDSSSLFRRCNVYRLKMESVSAHSGIGNVLFHRIANDVNLAGACNFIDFTQMPPGTSIGDHRHSEHEEEFYFILSGQGTMTVESESFPVAAGDLIRNPPGGMHGLRNDGPDTLSMLVFEVGVA